MLRSKRSAGAVQRLKIQHLFNVCAHRRRCLRWVFDANKRSVHDHRGLFGSKCDAAVLKRFRGKIKGVGSSFTSWAQRCVGSSVYEV